MVTAAGQVWHVVSGAAGEVSDVAPAVGLLALYKMQFCTVQQFSFSIITFHGMP
jgi:hypothetical protein